VKLKKLFQLTALLFLALPFAAHAYDSDTEYCGTRWPKWWWQWDGPRSQIAVQNWSIDPVGADFQVSFSLVNVGTTTFNGGAEFSVRHSAVDPTASPDPARLATPTSAAFLLGSEALARVTLPTLRPGQSTTVSASVRGFRTDANHVLTLSYHDSAQVQIEPEPNPWYWGRVLSPSSAPGSLRFTSGSVVPVTSARPGFNASLVTMTVQNVGRSIIERGTPILVVHGNAGSAGGNYSPDQDPVNPNDPSNPYAIDYREIISQGQLSESLYPGQSLTVTGTAYSPIGKTAIEQVTVEVGQ
jgi:hypothetical protein